ncbi:MAG: AMP-dependent synthetase, partial [Candidatus Nitrosothermus koennekii]
MYNEVNKLANGLKELGVKKGDRVTIYMPMIIEAIAAILACSRIGAIHNVVFSGFTSSALASRINDCNSKVIITTDGYYRRGKYVNLLSIVREAKKLSKIDHILIYQYKKRIERDDEIIINDILDDENSCKCEMMNAEDPLFILYTSGTTGKPKGVLHVHGGFMTFAAQQAAYLIDLKKDDILFWPADIGWITGQTWSVYGSLLIGATTILYDGAPDYPKHDHWFDIIDEHRVTIFGTAPTAIRLFMKYDITHKLDSLRILASTGESINKNEWLWYLKNIGRDRCPIMNLSGGTEIGGAILSPLPIMELEPCTVGGPVPGVDADVFDDNGNSIIGEKGYLVIKQPWPAMTRGLWNDPERYIEIYWSRFKDVWFHGDYASIDKGLWYLHGRVDDVIKVAGHRIASAEIEAVITEHPNVQEAAAIGIPDEVKGEAIILYVVKKDHVSKEELKRYIASKVGKIAMPKEVIFVNELPKTRTGKIMRRVLRAKF